MRAEPSDQAIKRVEKLEKRLFKDQEFRDFATQKVINESGFDELESYINKYLPKAK